MGAGLGLSLAVKVVELAGGQLSCESTIGEGTEFRVRWPMNMVDSITTGTLACDMKPVVLVVSARSSLIQSLNCTASLYDWESLDYASNLSIAMDRVEQYEGTRNLVVFVDSALVDSDPLTTTRFLSLLQKLPVSAAQQFSAPKKYAVLASRSPGISLDGFDCGISSPFHRADILSTVCRLCDEAARPSLDRPHSSNDETEVWRHVSLPGDVFPRGRLVR